MIQIENLTKRCGRTVVCSDLSLKVDNGEAVLLVGLRSGKTTLLRCAAGLLPFKGRIVPSASRGGGRVVGYLPEHPAVYDWLTVSEHVELIRRAYRLGQDSAAFADDLLTRLGFGDRRDRLGRECTSAEKKMLDLICVLLPRPQILLLDEPVLGLEPSAAAAVVQVLAERKAEGCSLLMAAHGEDVLMPLVDRTVLLVKGAIAATARPGEGDIPLGELAKELADLEKQTAAVPPVASPSAPITAPAAAPAAEPAAAPASEPEPIPAAGPEPAASAGPGPIPAAEPAAAFAPDEGTSDPSGSAAEDPGELPAPPAGPSAEDADAADEAPPARESGDEQPSADGGEAVQ